MGLKTELLTEDHGIFTLKITGKVPIYKHFLNEPGKHVVQRIPPTETQGRRHTSLVTVTVLPLLSEQKNSLNMRDVEIRTQKGHGPGGQHQNKTESAVRAVHVPTGITVFINGRDQYNNKKDALQILAARVKELERAKSDELQRTAVKQQVDSSGRGNKIRTYNFIDSRVTDHRLGIKTSNIKDIMKGKLAIFYKMNF